MFNFFNKLSFVAIGTVLLFPSLPVQIASAAPSLGDGIICVAKGRTNQGHKIYFYTSVIDNNSMEKKQPVSVTINESINGQMQPAGLASTTYQGNDTYSGKSQAGSPISFSLLGNYSVIQIQHSGQTFTGICH
ncbi:Similarity [Planktothrix tepida]|uniref:Similarity n=2 Tax=Planktothrix TaxID=54304 RepID=A0A1J1LJP9_9CYAN|nr:MULTISPECIES: hypothetical protein [Planktothrix]CAD5913971.1 Similarity [Planktothrix pseudagardhii]CAD5983724.1 Similarity [Planktothrix tepida]CUR32258.1 Similarity [Planktothrix tepida PCC 9214]